jgi:hypothetical protein
MLAPVASVGFVGRKRRNSEHLACEARRHSSRGAVAMTIRLFLFAAAGAAAGYAYHRLVGCRTGACMITANPWVSTLYGAILGVFASR